MRNSQILALSAADTATATGDALVSGQWFAASFTSVFGDATAAGSVKVQCSNDIPVGAPQSFTPVNWADIPSASSAVVAGVAAPIVIPQLVFAYVRVIFTRTGGGSSTVNVFANVQSV